MGKTRIFISSTCYDLSQIRQDLKRSITDMGHIPIMSENKDFPIDPMVSTQENCIEAVKEEADVFVLIIGNRYGYKCESGQSITNLEFLTAVQKGIPIYTFTLKGMIHLLPLWRKNPGSDYSEYVDDTKVFEFIDNVRSQRGLWNFEFEKAQDIIDILLSQLSILLSDSLCERVALKSSVDDIYLSKLSGNALSILLKKPDNYGTRLFLQMTCDEIGKHIFEKNDLTYSIYIKKGDIQLDTKDCVNWQMKKLQELNNIVEMLNYLLKAYNHFNSDAESPDIKGLYYVAQRYGELYNHIIQWVIAVRSVGVCSECEAMVTALSDLPTSIISQLEEFPIKSLKIIESTLEDVNAGKIEKGSTINLALKVGINEIAMKRITEEMEKIKSKYC